MSLAIDTIEHSFFVFGVISGAVIGVALLCIAFDRWMNR